MVVCFDVLVLGVNCCLVMGVCFLILWSLCCWVWFIAGFCGVLVGCLAVVWQDVGYCVYVFSLVWLCFSLWLAWE